MNFPFAPWEWAHPHHEWSNCADTRLNGYLVKSIPFRNWLFFRPIASQKETNFVVTYPDKRIIGPLPLPAVSEVRQLAPVDEVEEAIKQKRVGRIFFLDEQEKLRTDGFTAHHLVVVSAQGWAQWNHVMTVPQNETHCWPGNGREFLWSQELELDDFLSIPAVELWTQIEQQRHTPNSDCSFARSTLHWSEKQWDDFLAQWKRGTKNEFQQVLRSALLSQTSLWENTRGYRWLIDLNLLHTSWHRGKLWSLDGSIRSWRSAPLAPGILRDVLNRIAPYFEPAFNEELIATHLAAMQWRAQLPFIHYESHNMGWPIEIRVENPTAHERLEVPLFWREWQNSHHPIKRGMVS